jgi:glycosyltransferase involved in cell wall biosynthesis
LKLPVSVVIPCFRGASTIGRALDSVARQTRPAAEIIVVDDASDDGLREAIAGRDLRVISLAANAGAGGARNAGWSAATQEYVAFLDADDAWHPRKLELQVAWMQSHPQVALTGHAYARDAAPEAVSVAQAVKLSPAQLLVSNRFTTSSAIVRRSIAQRFADGKRHSEDYLLWLEIAFSGAPVYRLEAPLAVRFKPAYGAGGLSGQLWAHEAGELDAIARLRRAGRLGFAASFAASAWSWAKFVRRLAVVALRGGT